MNCRRARIALSARPSGGPGTGWSQEVRRHLDDCPACAAHARDEERIRGALERLRTDYPYRVDVRSEVLRRIAGASGKRQPSSDLSWRLAWIWTGTLAAGALLLLLLRELPATWRAAEGTFEGLFRAGASLVVAVAGAVATALEALVGAVVGLRDAWAGVGAALARLEPLAAAGVTICYLLVGATIVLVLSRDLRRPAGAGAGDGRE